MPTKLLVLALACTLASCSADPVPDLPDSAATDTGAPDSGSPPNNGTTPDAATPDVSTPQDTAPQHDASPTEDAGSDAAEADAAPPETEGGCLNDDCTLNVLVLGDEPGTSAGVFSQHPTEVRNRPAGTTGTATETCRVSGPFPVNSYHAFIEVRNETVEDATVDLHIDTAPAEYDGAIFAFSHLAAYAAVPQSDTEADDCLTGVNQKCPDEAASSDPRWPCLIEEYAPVVPASGSIWVYLGLHSPPAQPAGEVPLSFELRATRR